MTITYKDRTFCINKDCKATDCYRRLTPEIEQAAQQYGLPLAVSSFICLSETEKGHWELKDEEMS